MGYKPRYKYVQWPDITFKNNWHVGTVWPMQGKTEMYEVVMEPRGFSCTCPGFTYHGKCRHIARVGEAMAGRGSLYG